MDKIEKFMAHVDMVKVQVANTKDLVEEARKIHGLSKTATAALGRVLTMTALMGSNMKNGSDKLTIQILGNGPAGQIIAVANKNAKVKGYMANPVAEALPKQNGKLNVSGIVGSGSLNVIKDIGLKEPYVGSVPLQTGEIAEDFAYYFAVSEQTPTAVALGVLVNADGTVRNAGGYIIEALPDTPGEIITLIENRIKETPAITSMLEEGKTLEQIAKYITDDLAAYKTEELSPVYECDCTRERMEQALISIGKKDILELAQDEKTEIVCHFCNKKYVFTSDEIKNLI